MTYRTRLIAAAAAVTAAILAPLVIAGPASALGAGDNVLFYSNATYTDPTEEDANMIAALQASGATVTSFDGGDGSLLAWSTVLTASVDTLVIPENSGLLWLSQIADVKNLIKQWVENGGVLVLGSFAVAPDIITDVTGLPYIGSWVPTSAGTWTLQVVDPALAPVVDYADGTTTIDTGGWDASLLSIFTPVYANGTNVAVGRWSVGSGLIVGFGWDWFPNASDLVAGIPTPWNTALVTLASIPEPEPELAATGAEIIPLGAAAAALLLAGVIAFAVRRRMTEQSSATD